MLGVAIKAGTGEQFYALDGNPNVDSVPVHLVNGSPVTTLVTSSAIDTVYTSDSDGDSLNDFFEPAGGYLLSSVSEVPGVSLI